MDDLISRQTATKVPEEPTRTFVELVVEYPDPELCTYKEYKGKPYYSIKYIENGETHIGYGTYKPEVLSQFLKEYFISSAQPETYKEKLNEIASALSEKFAYMNTCLNERNIILSYLGVERSCEIHCYTDCTNTKCESHPSFAQPEPSYEAIKEYCRKRCLSIVDTALLEKYLPSAQPEHNPDDERKIADLHKMVNYLLSQLEQRWIPVREKPIEKGLMLVTYNDGDVDLLKQPTAYRRSDIVAWMPCLKPWKEGETDE